MTATDSVAGGGGVGMRLEVLPVEGIGDVHPGDDLAAAITEGLEQVKAGRICVIDVSVVPGSPARLAEHKHETASASA